MSSAPQHSGRGGSVSGDDLQSVRLGPTDADVAAVAVIEIVMLLRCRPTGRRYVRCRVVVVGCRPDEPRRASGRQLTRGGMVSPL
jgi:hypothetical protein